MYQHTKKKEWGLAILAWEEDDRRAYQFEDGNLRIFKDGYYQLLQPVKDPKNAEAIEDELYRQLALTEAHRQATREASASGEQLITLDDQLAIFLLQYPNGFEDDEWVEGIRGGEGRRLKRHRQAAIDEAQELLGHEVLKDQIEKKRYADAVRSMIKVWKSTDLVSVSEVKVFDAGNRRLNGDLVRALYALCYEDGSPTEAFTTYVNVLKEVMGQEPSWQFVTSLPALLKPASEITVRHGTFRDQAKTIAPRLSLEKAANAEAYQEIVTMVKALRGHLAANKHNPRDLMDVHDFIRVTLAPSAKKLLPEAVAARRAS